jgi:dTDP-4-dehydrorhamnose reductase
MKYLVLGASGYLGNTIYKKLLLKKGIQTCGTYLKHGGADLGPCNLFSPEDCGRTGAIDPDVIVWCVCDKDNEIELSQTGLRAVIRDIRENVRFIYVSTMIGEGANQTEDIIPHVKAEGEYLEKYINGKITGEQIVRRHSNHVIVRPGSIYGYDCDDKMDKRMRSVLNAAVNGETLSRTANMYASFIHVRDLADAVIELAENGFMGTINISGDKPASYFKFYRHLADLLNVDGRCVAMDYKPNEIFNTLDNTLRRSLLKTDIREIE